MWLFLTMLLFISIFIIVLIVRDLKRTHLANRMKSDFVSNMSHEIRTPVTAILGMNELIQLECTDNTILRYSENIEKAGKSLLGIINDILDFSKIEAGHMELSLHAYSLPELLSDLNLMVRLRSDEKNLHFTMLVDEGLPVMPIGDMQKLRQSITNLLTNAVKYTEKGEVKLSLKLLSTDEDSFSMEIAIEDTGTGIKADEMDKLYSAFDRLDIEKTRNIEGSGLGLAITQRMLRLMGSEINVESEYGKGSRFSFCIKQGIADKTPVGIFRAKDPVPENRPGSRRRASFTAPSARLLVVDDTPMNLQVIRGLLKGNGLTIDTAESGMECIECFEENTYDIVFLDHRMPNMDGVETLRELKKLYPDKLRKTPVISLTANALSGVREQMLKAGFTDYLTKPVSLSEMEQMLLKYIPKEKICMPGDPDPETALSLPAPVRSISALDTESGIGYCGDPEEYIEVLNTYRSSVGKRAGELSDLLSGADTDGMSLLLHSLKSTSRAIGALRLSETAACLEKDAKNKDLEALKKGVPDFITQYISLGKELDAAMEMD